MIIAKLHVEKTNQTADSVLSLKFISPLRVYNIMSLLSKLVMDGWYGQLLP